MAETFCFVYFEDEPHSRVVLEMILTRVMGFEHVYIFENSAHYMARLDDVPILPTVLFLDIHMEPHNGFEILTTLRNTPAYQDMTIIAITASVMNDEVDMLQDSGFDGAIAKPIDQVKFPTLLERILNGESVWNVS